MGESKAARPAITLADVERAAAAIRGAVVETPCTRSRTLSAILGPEIWLKFENLQFTASYKERGALNRLLALDRRRAPARRHRHVRRQPRPGRRLPRRPSRHSGDDRHARDHADRQSREHPPPRCDGHPRGKDARGSRGLREAPRRGARPPFIHPYDDPLVIAGQGTIALEMLAAAPELDVLVVPIGGGGLVSGMAIAAKALKPQIRNHRRRGRALSVDVQRVEIRAPARQRRYAGRRHRGQAARRADRADRARSSRRHHARQRSRDRARALSPAQHREDRGRRRSRGRPRRSDRQSQPLHGPQGRPRPHRRQHRCAPACERADARARARWSPVAAQLDIPDRPGELARVAAAIGSAGANIVEVYHQRIFTDLPARGTELNLVIETRDRAHLDAVLSRLKEAGYEVVLKSSAGETA